MKSLVVLLACMLTFIISSCGIDSATPWNDPVPEEDQVGGVKLNKYSPIINPFPEGKCRENFYFSMNQLVGGVFRTNLFLNVESKEKTFTVYNDSVAPTEEYRGKWSFKKDAKKEEFVRMAFPNGKVWAIKIEKVNDVNVIKLTKSDGEVIVLGKKNIGTPPYRRVRKPACKIELKRTAGKVRRLSSLSPEEAAKEKIDVSCRLDAHKEAIDFLLIPDNTTQECKDIKAERDQKISECPRN